MKIDPVYILLALITLPLIYILKFTGVAIGVILFSIKLLYDIGFIRFINIYRSSFSDGTYFFKEYTGGYSKMSPQLFEAPNQIITKFKNKKLSLCCVYYDNPSTTSEEKQRYTIGIFKMKTHLSNKADEELENYLLENGFKKAELPFVKSLYSKWEFVNMTSMYIGLKKFYSKLTQELQNPEFVKMFEIKSYKCSIEIYTENDVTFYIPINKQEMFLVHSSFAELPKAQ